MPKKYRNNDIDSIFYHPYERRMLFYHLILDHHDRFPFGQDQLSINRLDIRHLK